ncbi:MAG: MFS transporter, partial [Planctomycetota bacterium]
MFEPKVLAQIRSARRKFAAMAASYCMGVFNDSFFRQSAIWIALGGTAASLAEQDRMSGYIMTLFALPYLFFAAPAGWLADRFSKHHIIIAAKGIELVAMVVGAVGIMLNSWPLILTMVLIMGWQSCIFSPALNGTIPELYPQSYIPRANAILRTIVTISILGGVAASGLAVDYDKQDSPEVIQGIVETVPPMVDKETLQTDQASNGNPNEITPAARRLVGIVVVAVALLGFATSFGVPRRDAADPDAPFPWKGPWYTIREFWAIRKDYLLWITVLSTAYLWFVGSVVLLLLARLTKRQMERSTTEGSLVLAA